MLNKIILIITLVSSILQAADTQLPKDWWQRSSYKYNPDLLDQWLFHLDFSFVHSDERGNINKDFNALQSDFMFRKGHLSISGNYSYLEETLQVNPSIQQAGTKVYTNNYVLINYVLYDLTDYLFILGGYQYSRKIEILVYNRHLLYAGVGVYLLHNKKHVWRFVTAGTEDRVDFTSDPQNNIGWNPGVLLQQNYHYIYDSRLSLDFFAYYLFAKAKNHDEFGRKLDLNIQLYKKISIVPYIKLTHYDFMSLSNRYEDEEHYGIKLKISF